jgi:hypothetical protein
MSSRIEEGRDYPPFETWADSARGASVREGFGIVNGAVDEGKLSKTREESRFRSRSRSRFPCGTRGFGIMTQYFGAGFSEGRGGGGRLGVTAT